MKKLLLGITAFSLVPIAGSLWCVYNSLDSQVASVIKDLFKQLKIAG